LAASLVRQLGFPGSGTKSKTGERLKTALPLAFSVVEKSFGEFGRKIACQEGQKSIFDVSNSIDYK
jgi:hypothetical protein